MYRKDVFAKAGSRFRQSPPGSRSRISPRRSISRSRHARICLRGQTGWGQVFAPLTTVVNTFGGTWFDKDWNAQVNTGG